jgi:hypothetical protein
LSSGAAHLVRDALAKGCTFLLAQRGGWRRERFLRGDRITLGRLWERTPPAELALSFSEHSLSFLMWMTSARPGDKEPGWKPPADELTVGDLLLLFFAHEGLRSLPETLGSPDLRRRLPFAEHGLCWLAYPEDFTATPEEFRPNFKLWVQGTGSYVVEALQPVLAARWVAVESTKERLTDPQAVQALGHSQERALGGFLDAAEAAGRLDLARFLLDAGRTLLGPHAHAGMWTGQLNLSGMRLADRTATYHAAAVFLRQMDRLQAWERRARTVGYWDEGYQASQLWKDDWERFLGEDLHGRAQAIVRQMDPLRQAGAAAQQA